MFVNFEIIKDDDKGNKVCFMEKYFILVVSLDKEEGRKIVCWFIFLLLY